MCTHVDASRCFSEKKHSAKKHPVQDAENAVSVRRAKIEKRYAGGAAYPLCSNQPRASLGVIALMAHVMPASRDSFVLAAIVRRVVFAFDQHSSIGFNHGEYGGKYQTSAPRASI